MTTSGQIKVGQKFQSNYYNRDGVLCSLGNTVYTIYQITGTRVCYTDGQSHSSGSTNRKVKGSWLTIKGFQDRIENGLIRFL